MLEDKTRKKIITFLNKPRTVQEVAKHIGKNWRTADRYVDKIAAETGEISSRTFREGTRGALKIVYQTNTATIASTQFQERLERQILTGRKKEDFSPLDIYQYIDEKKRYAFLEQQADEYAEIEQDVVTVLRSAQKNIFIFSGNLSWANVIQGKIKVIDILEEMAEKLPIKIITRIDIASLSNIQKIAHINNTLGREAIEIRHCEQPLRCVLVDTKHARFKEVKEPSKYKKGELKKKTHLFYEIYDEEWNEWLQKLFWKMFSTGISLKKRLETLDSIKNVGYLTQ